MIPVTAQDEPSHFDERVRKKGAAFLDNCPNPTSQQFDNRAYWREVLPDLYTAYGKICAYSCQWISPPPTGFRTVEHFKSKTKHPRLAYEWSNYRLVCGSLNGCKGDHEDVLDPFKVQVGWFVIRFPSLLVKPGNSLTRYREKQVTNTIVRLRLNDELTCLSGRWDWLEEYCKLCDEGDEKTAFSYLQRHAPFLAAELQRQKLRGKVAGLLKTRTTTS